MKRAWTTLRLIVAASAVATSAALPARGDYLTFDIASSPRQWRSDARRQCWRLQMREQSTATDSNQATPAAQGVTAG